MILTLEYRFIEVEEACKKMAGGWGGAQPLVAGGWGGAQSLVAKYCKKLGDLSHAYLLFHHPYRTGVPDTSTLASALLAKLHQVEMGGSYPGLECHPQPCTPCSSPPALLHSQTDGSSLLEDSSKQTRSKTLLQVHSSDNCTCNTFT